MPAAPSQPSDHVPSGSAQSFGTDKSPEDLKDLQLVQAINAGNPDAWRQLLTKYQNRLYGVCLRVIGDTPKARQTAVDLTQDAMVKIIQGLSTFDGTAKLSTWMVRVTMNVCLSHLRSQKLRDHASLNASATKWKPNTGSGPPDKGPSLADFLVSREQSPLHRVSQEQARATVAAALSDLDPEQRAILVLRDANGLDYHQIAQVLDVPVGTIKSRLFRARLALRQACEQRSERP